MTSKAFALLLGGLIAFTQTGGAAEAPFAPLLAWKAAILKGDQTSLAKLYGPDARILAGTQNTPTAVRDELEFWAGMKNHGLTDITPRVLEMTNAGDKTRLLLRVSATSGNAHLTAGIIQEWIHQPDGWKITALKRNPFAADPKRTLPQPDAPNVKLYADPREAEPELKAALARAAKEGKRVMVVFGANWCYDCHVMDATFHAREFAPLVDANYVVVHINIGEDGKSNGDMAARLGVAIDKGVPSLAVLEADGKTVYAQKNGEFEATESIGPADVRAFLEKWKPQH